MSDEIDLSQFHQAFFEEANEHLTSMEKLLLALDMEDPDDEELNAIFRAAHSIKGSAGTFGFDMVAKVTHVLESILDRVRNHTTIITNERTDLFLEAGDILKDLIEAHENDTNIDNESALSIISRLEEDLNLELKNDSTIDDSVASEPRDNSDFGFFGDSSEETPTGQAPGDFGFFGDSSEETPTGQAPGDFGFFGDSSDETPASTAMPIEGAVVKTQPTVSQPLNANTKTAVKKTPEKTIRVGVDKVDQLVNLIGEMVITQSVIALQSALDANNVDDEIIDMAKLHESIHVLQRNVKDLQETIMSIRMVPVNTVFSRFPRLVRDMSTKLNKNIELDISGESTELDKGLIEKLSDPLTHILRNSIDHGIETIEERALTTKLDIAKVKINASQAGGNIVIQVADDGRGLNREKILSKAREKGISAPDNMPDTEVWQIIFAPGFSTADEVSEMSGRGVGMDVVKKNITSLGGRVEIQSEAGVGTTITIYLPLTMAILNGMIIKVQEVNYIVPMLSIIETLRPKVSAISKVGGGSSMVMEIRGEHVPIVDLRTIFRQGNDEHQTHREESKHISYYANKIFMLIEAEDKKSLIVLDELAGQQQVVIKNIEENYKKVTGISGATILGDGNIALILDTNYFVSLSNEDLRALDALRAHNDQISNVKLLGNT